MRLAESSSGRTKSLSSTCLPRMGISLATWSLLAIGGMLAPPASAQEVLPFHPRRPPPRRDSPCRIRSTRRGSSRVLRLPRDCAEHPHHPHGRRRPRSGLDLWRRDQHADAQSRGEVGHFLQSLSLDGDVLAHVRVAAVARNDTGTRGGEICELANDWDGFAGIIPSSSADRTGGAQELRLQDRRYGQVAQYARRADDRLRAVRVLANRLRL